jgi:type IV pilus assembly protein PilQ
MRFSQIVKTVPFLIFLLIQSCSPQRAVVQPSETKAPEPIPVVSSIQKISVAEEENFTRVQLVGSESLETPFYKLLSDPVRIVIDIPRIDLKQIKEPIQINNGTVISILTTQYDDKGRIEIGLTQMASYNITKEEKSLTIDIEKVKPAPVVKEVIKEEVAIKPKEPEPPSTEPKPEEKPVVQPQPAPPAPTMMNEAKAIVNIFLEQAADFVLFHILGDGKLGNYNSFKLDSPSRLVLDIWGVDLKNIKRSIKIKNPMIKEVRVGLHPEKLRLVFDSLSPKLPPYQIHRMDDRCLVLFGTPPPTLESRLSLPKAPAETIAPPAKWEAKIPPKTEIKTERTPLEPKKAVPINHITGIEFKQMDLKSRIQVALTEDPQVESQTLSKNLIVVYIKNAIVPKHLQRGLDTREFENAVKYVSIKNVKKEKKPNEVRISIQLKEDVPFETTQEGKLLFIDFPTPPKKEVKAEPVPRPQKEPPVEIAKEEVKKEAEKPLPPLPPTPVVKKVEEVKASEEAPSEKGYTGKKLSLDFKDADIKNILRLIAEVSNLNIIAGDDVTGKISMRLVDVPWDQALEVILQARGLEKRRAGNVIRVAPREVLKKEDQEILEAKRAKEKLEDLVNELIPINYASGKDILPQVKSILSDRGDVKVDERTNILIIKDIPKNIAEVKNLVKALDTKTPQVLIEARIVEANITFQRELGVSWGFELGGGVSTLKGGLTDNKLVDLPAVARGGVPGTTGTTGVIEFIFSRGTIKDLDVAISAHENKGDVRVISSPKIATLDNKEASIEQGLRIPYLKLTTEGTVTTDFIDANLKLTVTPHVTNDGNIKLNIKAKKDAPDQTIVVQGVPSIDKKEAMTEVLIKDNGVVVIAGIYTIEKSVGTEGIPLFSKIPLLGYLFKREAKEDKRKDLLIFISPKIIKDQG